jgi:mannose-1-phosphate guanylyltransferase
VTRWAVVLAGGVGSRFWPLSTEQRPKQLLPLVTDRPLLVEQLERLAPLADATRTMILTNAGLVDAIRAAAPLIPPENVVAEPRPAGTAAALTWAAHLIAQRDGDRATMISVHADWAIGDPDGFRATLGAAAAAAESHDSLVTVGVVPTRPDPGFGYVQPGAALGGPGPARRVSRFVEKPTRERAESMCADGYLWNSGIFAWRVGVFLNEVRALAPEVAPALAAHGDSMTAFFGAVKSIAVDHAVLERSSKVLVVPGDFGWDDVGTWGALHRVRAKDASGNAVSGPVHALDASNNVVHAEGQTQRVVLFGVKDLVVVSIDGVTLVTTVSASANLKRLVESLPAELRERT